VLLGEFRLCRPLRGHRALSRRQLRRPPLRLHRVRRRRRDERTRSRIREVVPDPNRYAARSRPARRPARRLPRRPHVAPRQSSPPPCVATLSTSPRPDHLPLSSVSSPPPCFVASSASVRRKSLHQKSSSSPTGRIKTRHRRASDAFERATSGVGSSSSSHSSLRWDEGTLSVDSRRLGTGLSTCT